jgi:hypothetical protein
MKEVIALVDAARKRGVEFSADQHPYVASSTGLSQTIPPWAHEGGGAKMAERLKRSGDARGSARRWTTRIRPGRTA